MPTFNCTEAKVQWRSKKFDFRSRSGGCYVDSDEEHDQASDTADNSGEEHSESSGFYQWGELGDFFQSRASFVFRNSQIRINRTSIIAGLEDRQILTLFDDI